MSADDPGSRCESPCDARRRELEAWIVAEIARELEVDADEIDVDAPVTELGIDSTTAIVLSTCLEDRLGRSLAPGLLWEHPTIADLARHLTGEHAGSRRRGGAQNSK